MKTKGGKMPESFEPGDLNYHYNREEREALLSEDAKKLLTTKSRFFSINKRSLLILADILFIMIVAVIFIPLSVSGNTTARIEGFKGVLTAYEYDGQILVSLKVNSMKEGADNGFVKAEFSIDDEEPIVDMDILPSKEKELIILRASFPVKEYREKKISCDFEINDSVKRLTARIKKE